MTSSKAQHEYSALRFGPTGAFTGALVGIVRKWAITSGGGIPELVFGAALYALAGYGMGCAARWLLGRCSRSAGGAFAARSAAVVVTVAFGALAIWEVAAAFSAARSIRTLVPKGFVHGVAFSPDHKVVAVATWDGVWLWNAQTPASSPARTLKATKQSFETVADVTLSPDGRTLAAVMEGWDLLDRSAPAAVLAEMFLLDNRVAVCLWDVETGTLRQTLKGGGWPMTFSPDGRLLATGSAVPSGGDIGGGGDIGKVRLWETQTGKPLQTLPGRGSALAFTPDAKTLASLDEAQGVVTLWNLATGKPARALPVGRLARVRGTCLIFSPDGTRLTLLGVRTGPNGNWVEMKGEVHCWDVATGRRRSAPTQFPFRRIDFHPALALSPDGKTLALREGRQVQLRDAQSGALSAALAAPGGAGGRSLFFSPDSDLQPWLRLATGRIEYGLEGVKCLAFSPDGEFLAVGTSRKVRLWNARSGGGQR